MAIVIGGLMFMFGEGGAKRQISVAYVKPFDLLVEGNETEDWLGGRDSNPDNGVQSAVSYR